jgi:hypothetical protein
MTMSPEERTHAINEFRARYNTALASVGFIAPPPVAGQTVGGYRRHALQTFANSLLPQNHKFAQLNFESLPFQTIKIFEPQILNDCVFEATNPANVPKGEMKMVKVINDQTGRVEKNVWIGQECFTKQMMRPGRRITGFWTEHGYIMPKR